MEQLKARIERHRKYGDSVRRDEAEACLRIITDDAAIAEDNFCIADVAGNLYIGLPNDIFPGEIRRESEQYIVNVIDTSMIRTSGAVQTTWFADENPWHAALCAITHFSDTSKTFIPPSPSDTSEKNFRHNLYKYLPEDYFIMTAIRSTATEWAVELHGRRRVATARAGDRWEAVVKAIAQIEGKQIGYRI